MNHAKTIHSYQLVFSSIEGTEVLHDLAKVCGAYTSSHSTDPYTTAFNEGKREAYNHIIRMIERNMELVNLQSFPEQIHRTYVSDVGREQLRSMLQQEETSAYD